MNTCERSKSMFVGVDIHKDTHTAVGLSPFGEKLFEKTIGNYEIDFVSLMETAEKFACASGLRPVFGLEDCSGFGERIAAFLDMSGYPVTYVPPVLVDDRRKFATHPEKNDSLDARGVAEVLIQRIDRLPSYTLTEEAKNNRDVRELSIDREYLVSEQTRLKNQLHTILHRIWNTEYKDKFKNSFSVKALRYWTKVIPKDTSSFLVHSMKRKVRRLQAIREEIIDIEKEVNQLMNKSGHTLHTANGCGIVIASMIIGEVGDIARFHSPGALAKYAGCAPREHSSGKTFHHRKSRSGNRRLNCAFHRMALSQISRMGNEKAKNYFHRKISEGKSKQQALVCLRRQMVNIVWMMMKHKTEYIT